MHAWTSPAVPFRGGGFSTVGEVPPLVPGDGTPDHALNSGNVGCCSGEGGNSTGVVTSTVCFELDVGGICGDTCDGGLIKKMVDPPTGMSDGRKVTPVAMVEVVSGDEPPAETALRTGIITPPGFIFGVVKAGAVGTFTGG